MKVRPRYIKRMGKLVPSKIIDETYEFKILLNECNIPFEEQNGTFIIYGYRKL